MITCFVGFDENEIEEKKCTKSFFRSQKFCVNKKLTLRGRPAKLADRKLQKSDAVDEEDETTEDEESSSVEVPEEPPKTQWEELQDIYFQQRFIRARNASQESLLEDEFDCKINLSNMYEEPTEKSPKKLEKVISQDTLDVIDDFIKSFEKEMNDDAPKISVEP